MVLKKLLQLFCVKKKDPKKNASASHSTVSVTANKSILDPCSSGTGTVLWVQKHESECSSSSMARIGHGTEINDYKSFNQFDVVQDFSDHHYAKKSPGKTTKDWVKAIQSDWKLLQKDLPESIYVRVYEERIDLLRAAIVGPAGTPYHDGLFFFDVCFPSEYPKCPPKVHYHSGGLRLNPNLYASGKVCLSLLNTWWGNGCEKWGKSNSTMLQVLVSIQGLVLNDKPYFNEPFYKNSANTAVGEKNSLAYNQTAFLLSCKTMLYSLWKPPKHFESLVARHFHERERVILDACSTYMSGTVVGSSVGNGTKYACDKCFADFKKSMALYTEHLRAEFAANRTRVLELKREASTEDEIVPTS
ncbi:putative ubiquitin-conjugating enzyme E2 38 [Phragmites australis]|uniref:putative ubiquitin-conjugating enzyme E2 38 n=1 Tax=Phragmites australis TaxID=29695 RepID=UPI002D774A51|nr:putative ubiquitin-conjugating enzyme E2 38 [Phragmites australis]XP_062230993.1 putative ubiquitin-conjugating enzyme E2 38 [Phragmites australis]XP_062231060.1 putative ubiquitin-conjugating enzyme E2 38 [Phragmites australis]XP_062231138.1 putative ubiquitin-conjugating enzyme E2 38 [Phragmites australis]XP_062231204.1 putative ubiquitin-conjugating enzyme E2 38 [Phragmites australis]